MLYLCSLRQRELSSLSSDSGNAPILAGRLERLHLSQDCAAPQLHCLFEDADLQTVHTVEMCKNSTLGHPGVRFRNSTRCGVPRETIGAAHKATKSHGLRPL
jgi:hypothetical protein